MYPREVEEVLLTHPGVRLAAVTGVPHPGYGEEIKAVVILEPGSGLSKNALIAWCGEKDALIAWCGETTAAHKYPRVVEFAETLPMTATGKILERDLATPNANA
ncbi:hypothetical protein [Streptomyces sp. NPDC059894]|uniref:AMP-binding enzyme n=1 Tax=unclassified Streptomyces TaxID=2593676 RepID=UPI00365C1D40